MSNKKTYRIEETHLEEQCMSLLRMCLLADEVKTFGVPQEDRPIVNELILSARFQDGQTTPFPDFVADMGIIEHFQVSASKFTHKGSTSLITAGEHFRAHEKVLGMDDSKSICVTCARRQIDYDGLQKSLQHGLMKHIKSLQKYNGTPSRVMFMIQFDDAYAIKLEPEDDQLVNARKPLDYHLYLDKAILLKLAKYKDLVSHYIFVESCSDIAILQSSYIPQQIEGIKRAGYSVNAYGYDLQDSFITHRLPTIFVQKEAPDENRTSSD